ncbi:complex I subunit 5 family protein [Phenylobacterium sp.]|uniref:complex I subunit 5 family protein n=1 Tax=Phenylobacterium sp. TaxID=1871053 RepID=UPI00272F2035|nr:proton-conducting transporter membrane subunit [Phenylobacterium sp.]MDP2212871.1 proton-conducting transporter membrane subunit [Phenylobacterium sp.]
MAEAALAIALPVAAALLAVPAGRRAPWLLWPVAPGSLVLAWLLAQGAPSTSALGGWEAPLGIVLRVDGLAAIFVGLSAVIGSAAGVFAVRYLQAREETRKSFAFWPLFFSLWAAVNAVFLSRDLFNLYVGLELLTLSAVAMVALDGRTSTLVAAARYLLFALFGSVAFLIGTALLYGAYGVLDMVLLADRIRPEPASWVAAALMSVGLLAKMALFPFHAWLPPAHGGAPAPASALLSALVVKASFYIFLRLWFDVLPPLATPGVMTVFGLLGATAVVYGAALAIRQQRLKLIIAYSTVAQLGYLFLIFPLAGIGGEPEPWAASAWSGGVFQALAHGLAKAAMFLAAGAMILSASDDRLSHMAGVGQSAPVASFAFALSAVSLMGLPPSGGFLAKYLVLTASLASGQWYWGAVLIVGGLMSAIYLFRPLNPLMRKRSDDAPPLARVHWTLEAAPLALAISAILLGVASMGPYQLIQIGNPVAMIGGPP